MSGGEARGVVAQHRGGGQMACEKHHRLEDRAACAACTPCVSVLNLQTDTQGPPGRQRRLCAQGQRRRLPARCSARCR